MRNSYASRPPSGACSCCTWSAVKNGRPRNASQLSSASLRTSPGNARPNGPRVAVLFSAPSAAARKMVKLDIER
eukprot:5758004-Prymnesium_polylepis.1